MHIRAMILLPCLVLLISASTGFAQPGPEDDAARQRVEEFRRIKLIEILDLDEEQAIRLFTREKDFRKKESARNEKAEALLGELKDLLVSNASDDQIKEQIEAISASHQAIMKDRQEYVFSLRDILSMKQIGKLVLFEHRFSKELRKMILDRSRGNKGRR